MRPLKTLMVAGLALVAAGCMDLDTENLNAPDRERALSEPGDIESLIASQFRTWFYGHQRYNPSWALSVGADEGSSSWGNYGMQDFSSEPRRPFPNSTGYGYNDVVEQPWYDLYETISSVNDGLRAIKVDGIQIGPDGRDNTRAVAFGKFVQGLAHGYLALLFDRAFIYTEDMTPDDLADAELQPYTEVMAAAIQMLEEAITEASKESFTLPENWINGQEYTNTELIRIIHSYIARFLAYNARTPAERANAPWAEIIQHVDAGIREDFGPILDNTTWTDPFKNYSQRFDWFRADYRLVGPADISGNYQAWLATPVSERMPFDITTPDRRITGDTPTSDGTDFYYRETQNFRADRGTYHFSRYGHKRYYSIRQTNSGFDPIMTVTEMDLLKAEGLIRLGQPDQAAALINKTRVARGQLPPVTATGPAPGPDCVPRKINDVNGACGDLMDALMYEKRIEGAFVASGVAYFDARGWGILVSGTPLHLPIPARELETLQMPVYTFGGVGGADAAP